MSIDTRRKADSIRLKGRWIAITTIAAEDCISMCILLKLQHREPQQTTKLLVRADRPERGLVSLFVFLLLLGYYLQTCLSVNVRQLELFSLDYNGFRLFPHAFEFSPLPFRLGIL